MKPVIGITADIDDAGRFSARYAGKKMVHLWDAYLDAARDTGGIPVLLAPTRNSKDIKQMLSRVDRVIISGGAFDVPPSFYGEKILKAAKVKPKPERAGFERKLILEAKRWGVPVLGICGGEQIINVAFGGSLFQDLRLQVKTKIKHEPGSDKETAMHEVNIQPGSLLARLLFENEPGDKKTTLVNSSHHQAIKKPGKGLRVSAIAADGLIEAIEAKKGFIIGVQWHPERLYQKMPEQFRLLERFVAAEGKAGGKA